MKKFIIAMSLIGISLTGFAQDIEEKVEAEQSRSPELAALQTAADLAKYGYANYSPTALIEAARIFAVTQVQEADFKKTKAGTPSGDKKEPRVSFDPQQLLSDAKKFAGKDKTVLALAKRVEEEVAASSSTRGAVGGAKYSEDRVYGKDYVDYQCKFWANELAEVIVIGDGDNDLDLYIYDGNGNLIASDTDYTDQCVCSWVPRWTGVFTIRILNRGSVYSNYAIATN